ncbi:MAG: SGNH/GDSL hydrolase family protein [Pyrinomonadaceae bacterium]|nr:SGNH/GDSL hydrolase family protein [Pyrinomonadaceae bacterium]
MLIRRSISSTSIAVIVIAILALAAVNTSIAQQPAPDSRSKPIASDPLHMLVLGDSIMWGQGLKTPDKTWWRLKNWLQEKTGRDVRERIEAHSGAAVEAAPGSERFNSNDGEVNLLTPTINDQVDAARKYYGDPAQVDLILVNGCINDVDVRNLLDAATSLPLLETSIREKCGVRMQSLLQRVTGEFPNAHVVVSGYYRIISPLSDDNSFARRLVKNLTTQKPETRQMSDKQMRENLVAISELWYQVSTRSLAQAVAAVNSDLEQRGAKQRILFAEIPFSSEHAFSAPDTLLWNFMFGSTNLSGLRLAIVVVTLGTAAYKPNDEVRDRRSKSCKETYKRPKGEREDKAQKEQREVKYLACRYASLGHPNKMGALIYTEAIKGQLQWVISQVRWLRKPASLQTNAAQ